MALCYPLKTRLLKQTNKQKTRLFTTVYKVLHNLTPVQIFLQSCITLPPFKILCSYTGTSNVLFCPSDMLCLFPAQGLCTCYVLVLGCPSPRLVDGWLLITIQVSHQMSPLKFSLATQSKLAALSMPLPF